MYLSLRLIVRAQTLGRGMGASSWKVQQRMIERQRLNASKGHQASERSDLSIGLGARYVLVVETSLTEEIRPYSSVDMPVSLRSQSALSFEARLYDHA